MLVCNVIVSVKHVQVFQQTALSAKHPITGVLHLIAFVIIFIMILVINVMIAVIHVHQANVQAQIQTVVLMDFIIFLLHKLAKIVIASVKYVLINPLIACFASQVIT